MPVRRRPISKTLQIEVFRRDGWICRWCGCPVIFGPAMRHLERFVRQSEYGGALAYYHAHWNRRDAPLLDHLGANIDHVEAHSKGGAHGADNFATACNKCNMRKSSAPMAEWDQRKKHNPVKGRYGEPTDWDGFSTLFIVLVERDPKAANASELAWLRALKARSKPDATE